MAKYTEIEGKCRKIVEDARNGVFAPVYLLMGGEPYYPDMVCDAMRFRTMNGISTKQFTMALILTPMQSLRKPAAIL